MQNKWTQRLALGLAASALFVAAGGPSYAASKINGKNIKSKSIAGSKLKNNTVTGTQVNESKLGKVPSASSADSAASAANATNATNASNASLVGGLKVSKIAYRANLNTPATQVFSGGGLTLTATCSAGGDISIQAVTAKNDANIQYSWLNTASTQDFADGDGAGSGAGDTAEDNNFDISGPLALTFDDSSVGQINYHATDNTIASVNLALEEDTPVSNNSACTASGSAVSG